MAAQRDCVPASASYKFMRMLSAQASESWTMMSKLKKSLAAGAALLVFILCLNYASISRSVHKLSRNVDNKLINEEKYKVDSRLLNICFLKGLPKEYFAFLDSHTAYVHGDFGFGPSSSHMEVDIRKTHWSALHTYYRVLLPMSNLYVDDCDEADAVFIPYDVGLDVSAHYKIMWEDGGYCGAVNSSCSRFWTVFSELTPVYKTKPYLLPISRVEGDFMKCDQSESRYMPFLCLPEASDSIIFWSIEKRSWDVSHPNLFAAPYPGHTHRTVGGNYTMNYSSKKTLVFATWATRSIPTRVMLDQHLMLMERQSIESTFPVPPATTMQGVKFYFSANFDNIYATNLYRDSVFCLEPPGDTPTRSSLWDALTNGCIPVMFSHLALFPFGRWIDWGQIVLYINPEDLKFHNIVDILRSVPLEEIQQRQSYLDQFRHVFQYSLSPAWENVRLSNIGKLQPTDDATVLLLKEVFLHAAETFPLTLKSDILKQVDMLHGSWVDQSEPSWWLPCTSGSPKPSSCGKKKKKKSGFWANPSD